MDISSMAKELGKRGGEARARNLTPKRRQEIATNAINKRWTLSGKYNEPMARGCRFCYLPYKEHPTSHEYTPQEAREARK